MSDDEDILRYDRMVETALRGVVKQSVEEVIDHGLPGDHHFYITFLTDFPGVKIPDYLRDRYPGEMTIVLQYQFSDLYVDDTVLKVTLSFNNVPEKLEVPLAAISIFADPSVSKIEKGDFKDMSPSDVAWMESPYAYQIQNILLARCIGGHYWQSLLAIMETEHEEELHLVS